jgi:hypothetical protein
MNWPMGSGPAGRGKASLLLALMLLSAGGCERTVVETEVVEHVDTLLVHDTVLATPRRYAIRLVAEGLGPVSGHLTDATMTAGGPVVSEQRGVVQSLSGAVVWVLPVPASEFGGLLGMSELNGTLYAAYSDSLDRLTVSDRQGRVVYQTVPYTVKHYGGGLTTYDGKLLLGYGNRASFTGPGDQRHGGVVAIDPTTMHVDTIAIGLRSPFKLAVWDHHLIISSAGEFLHEGLYRADLSDALIADFGYPAWEGPVCHVAAPCPPRTAPWYTYPTAAFGCSAVVGGAVWDGKYWFSDFCEGWIRTIDQDGQVAHVFDLPGRIAGLKTLGESLLVLGYDGGHVWQISAVDSGPSAF